MISLLIVTVLWGVLHFKAILYRTVFPRCFAIAAWWERKWCRERWKQKQLNRRQMFHEAKFRLTKRGGKWSTSKEHRWRERGGKRDGASAGEGSAWSGKRAWHGQVEKLEQGRAYESESDSHWHPMCSPWWAGRNPADSALESQRRTSAEAVRYVQVHT